MSLQKLSSFIKKAPTAWHAVHEITHTLREAGFCELEERDAWKLKSGSKYYIRRDGSLIAFILPKKKLTSSVIMAAHTDSPALKLKVNGEFTKDNCTLLNFEVYGSPILASWIGRDLALAGRIFYSDKKGKPQSELVYFKDHPIQIPHLAIHLDRGVNESFSINKQEQLSAIACLDNGSFLERLFQGKNIIHTELFAVPLEEPRFFGIDQELFTAYRLDNLASCHALLEALTVQSTHDHHLQMGVFWNHEEVGSLTREGANSSYLQEILERIHLRLSQEKEEFFRCKANTTLFSIDVAHAAHPNYSEKHDPRHKPLLGEGVCLKLNAQERYSADGKAIATFVHHVKKEAIPLQTYVCRTDIPSGSTVGPFASSSTGIRSIDIGIPLVAMHASREIISTKDYEQLVQVIHTVCEPVVF